MGKSGKFSNDREHNHWNSYVKYNYLFYATLFCNRIINNDNPLSNNRYFVALTGNWNGCRSMGIQVRWCCHSNRTNSTKNVIIEAGNTANSSRFGWWGGK